jgi:hypothetical protein
MKTVVLSNLRYAQKVLHTPSHTLNDSSNDNHCKINNVMQAWDNFQEEWKQMRKHFVKDELKGAGGTENASMASKASHPSRMHVVCHRARLL